MATINAVAAKDIGVFLDSGVFSDVGFILNQKNGAEKRFVVHKVILASSSSVFNALFNGDLKKEEGDIRITDATVEGFAEFLQLFYKPKVNLTVKNIREVTQLVDKYDVTGGFETIKSFLLANVTEKNMHAFIELATTYQLTDMSIANFKSMISKNHEIPVVNYQNNKKTDCSLLEGIAIGGGIAFACVLYFYLGYKIGSMPQQ